MTSLRFESPLTWPQWVVPTPRASQRSDHGFPAQLTLSESIGYLEQEVGDLHASGTLSMDIEQPGVERLRKKVGSLTGACLQLKYHGRNYVLACDQWLAPEHNVYALHLALRQWRNMERWGLGSIPVLLKGFEPGAVAAQEVNHSPSQAWMEGLGLGPTATLEDAVAVYHRRAKQAAHDEDVLTHLNQMIDEARTYFASRNG